MNKNSQVKQYFERSHELFNTIYTGEKSAFGRWLDRLLRPDIEQRFVLTLEEIQTTKPDSVLDVGVGPGQYLKAYAELGVPEIIGLDISAPMIELARQGVGKPPDGVKVSYIVSDFMDQDFEISFGVSVAMGVLDYIAEPVGFLTKMKNLTSQSVLISFPSLSVWRTPIRKLRYAYKRCPVYFYTRKKIEVLARHCGFKSCEIIKIKGSGMDYWVKYEC